MRRRHAVETLISIRDQTSRLVLWFLIAISVILVFLSSARPFDLFFVPCTAEAKEQANARPLDRDFSSIFRLSGEEVLDYMKNTPTKKDYPEANAVVLHAQKEVEVKEKGKLRRTLRFVTKIFDEQGVRKNARVLIGFNSHYQSIDLISARTISREGKTTEVPAANAVPVTPPSFVAYEIYSEIKQLSISFPALQEGSIILWEVVIEDKIPFMEGEWWDSFPLQGSDPVLRAKYILKNLDDRFFQYKTLNISIEPHIEKNKNITLYSWEINGLGAVKTEDYSPPRDDLAASILLTSIRDWEEVNRWFQEKFNVKAVVTERIQNRVRDLTSGLRDRKKKIEAIFYFMESQIRYVASLYGMHDYEPHAADEVLRLQYGDCKDQTVLMISMLGAAGVKAYPALLSPFSTGEIDPQVPSVGQVSHVICYVPLKDGDLWLDATSETTLFGDIPFGLANRWTLVIGAPNVRLTKTPVMSARQNSYSEELKADISEDGSAEVEESFRCSGVMNQIIKSSLRNSTPDEVRKSVHSEIALSYPKSRISEFQISKLNAPMEPYHMRVKYWTPNYLQKEGRTLTYSLSADHLSSIVSFSPAESRIHDFVYYGPLTASKSILIVIPEDFVLSRLPKGERLESRYASFDIKYEMKSQCTLSAIYFFTLVKDRIPKQEYAEFYEFIAHALDRSKQTFVFCEDIRGGKRAKEQEKRLEFLTRDLASNPENPEVCYELGRYYMDVGRYPLAIENLSKAASLKPTDGKFRYYLGIAYGLSGDYYNSQLEIRAAKNLGFMPE